MTFEERRKLYAQLAAPFPEECVERTDGRLTGRGYSTSGIKYQFIVNRLNEVLGPGSFRAHRTVTVKEVTTQKGRTAYEAICDLTLELGWWEDGKFVVWAEALADGGHQSFSEADARKGAYTNAFKKAAAFIGVGRQAYEGTLDDDNLPEDPAAAAAHAQKPVSPPAAVPAKTETPQVAVRRTPAPAAATPGTQQTQRNRITSRQHSAVFSLARKAGIEFPNLRSQVKAKYATNLEFLTREQASELIEALNRKLNANAEANGAVQEAS